MSGESVYSLLPVNSSPQLTDRKRKPRHYKKSSKSIPPPSVSTFGIQGTSTAVANVSGADNAPSIHPAKKPMATFGRSVGNEVHPSDYLRKNEGIPTVSRGAHNATDSNFKISQHHTQKVKSSIPTKNQHPVVGMRTRKNYVIANAVENILSIPTKSTNEDCQRPAQRPDYGSVPKYLQQVKKQISLRRQYIANALRSHEEANERWRQLDQSEISALRSGLQQRWTEVNKLYQLKSFNKQSTPSQRALQENLEKKLRNLQFAMSKVNRPNIFVYNDQLEQQRIRHFTAS